MNATVHHVFESAEHLASASMPLDPAGQSVRLEGAQHLRLHDAQGWLIRAVSGAVWITQDGDTRDVVLEAGESFVLDRNGTALLSPFKEARICLSQSNAARNAPAPRPSLAARTAFA